MRRSIDMTGSVTLSTTGRIVNINTTSRDNTTSSKNNNHNNHNNHSSLVTVKKNRTAKDGDDWYDNGSETIGTSDGGSSNSSCTSTSTSTSSAKSKVAAATATATATPTPTLEDNDDKEGKALVFPHPFNVLFSNNGRLSSLSSSSSPAKASNKRRDDDGNSKLLSTISTTLTSVVVTEEVTADNNEEDNNNGGIDIGIDRSSSSSSIAVKQKRSSSSCALTESPSTEVFDDSIIDDDGASNNSQRQRREPMEMESIMVGYSTEDGLEPLEGDVGQEMIYQHDSRRQGLCGLSRCYCCGRCIHRRPVLLLMTVLLVLILVVIVPVTVVVTQQPNNKDKGSSSTNQLVVDGIDDDDNNNNNGPSSPSGQPDPQPRPPPVGPGDDTFIGSVVRPFSTLDPVTDLGLVEYNSRPAKFLPSSRLDPLRQEQQQQQQDQQKRTTLPTNSWYQSLLRLGQNEVPTSDHRVYTVPYIIDVNTAAATTTTGNNMNDGIRVHPTRLTSSTDQVTVTIDEPYALFMGWSSSNNSSNSNNVNGYSVVATSDLSVTLQWSSSTGNSIMTTTLTRGMPYVTMVYSSSSYNDGTTIDEGTADEQPTVFIGQPLAELPIVDQTGSLNCDGSGSDGDPEGVPVQKELEFGVMNGGKIQRWLLFFSRPVQVVCSSGDITVGTTFRILNDGTNSNDTPLVVRAALLVANGSSAGITDTFEEDYRNLLRSGSNVYPGPNPTVKYAMNIPGSTTTAVTAQSKSSNNPAPDRAKLTFDWDAKYMTPPADVSNASNDISNNKMIMYSLPHHQDILDTTTTQSKLLLDACTPSLLGKVCIVESLSSENDDNAAVWEMYEDLPPVGLRALRSPQPRLVPKLANALLDDIQYQIPANFQIGAADTYFSSKTMARLARILLITEELAEICGGADGNRVDEAYVDVCNQITLPSQEDINSALDQLRSVVTIWVKENKQAPFVYDSTWGGTVNCGCLYSNGVCTNAPNATIVNGNSNLNCPAFTDQMLNFGNGVYNDHHFHYGYLVYAAAVLSHFDPDWSVGHFEHVMLLVRDFANPSTDDNAYPVFRNKDWYKGHSWASGITDPIFPHIMNQESSSEAIAAYEAVALLGQVMTKNFDAVGDIEKTVVATEVYNVGLILASTEIRSTQKYWQIYNRDVDSDSSYPEPPYDAGVVGILWETMIQFTTWFGNSPYLIYGIQLLPLTPLSEQRDSPMWAEAIYSRLAQSCDTTCVSEGWAVQIFALLATLGQIDDAIDRTEEMNPSVYLGPGGNGHSKSNTIWYIATRPSVTNPDVVDIVPELPEAQVLNITCDQPTSCTDAVLEAFAGDHTCRSRIEWVMNVEGLTETASCSKVSGEFAECQKCNPSGSEFNNVNQDVNDMVTNPPEVEGENEGMNGSTEPPTENLTCFQPSSCTTAVLNRIAGGFTCRDRIEFLMDATGQSEPNACRQVSVIEHPDECGPCAPPNVGGRRRRRRRHLRVGGSKTKEVII